MSIIHMDYNTVLEQIAHSNIHMDFTVFVRYFFFLLKKHKKKENRFHCISYSLTMIYVKRFKRFMVNI